MHYMREGGYAMWVIAAIAVVSLGLALWRRKGSGHRLALYGCLGCLVLGVLGQALGMELTTNALYQVPAAEQARVLAAGLNESVNNGVFGAAASLVLGVLSLGLMRARRPAV